MENNKIKINVVVTERYMYAWIRAAILVICIATKELCIIITKLPRVLLQYYGTCKQSCTLIAWLIGILYHYTQSHLLKILSTKVCVSSWRRSKDRNVLHELVGCLLRPCSITKTFQVMYIMSFQPCYDVN